jgi:hypothetical protein
MPVSLFSIATATDDAGSFPGAIVLSTYTAAGFDVAELRFESVCRMENTMNDPNRDLAQRIVDLLNDMLRLDPKATSELFGVHVECNEALAAHPTIQVGPLKGSAVCYVGILGVLNGLVGVTAETWGIVAAVIEGDEWEKGTEILRFEVLDRELVQTNPAKYPRQVLDDLFDAGEITLQQHQRLVQETR